MTTTDCRHPSYDRLKQLETPPRAVPLGLRLHLLSQAVLMPSLAFCLALSFGLPSLVHLNLLNAWRLSQGSVAVQGTLTGCGRQFDLIFWYRYYQYTFRPPDGSLQTGMSYGSPTPAMEAARVIERGVPSNFPVPVEYAPEHPQASRIRGTNATNVAGQTLWPLAFLACVLFILLGQLVESRAKIRLLRHGVAAKATITACRYFRSTDDQEGQLLSVDAYRARWRAEHSRDCAPPDVMTGTQCLFTFLTSDRQEIQATDTVSLDARSGVAVSDLAVLYLPSVPTKASVLDNLGPALLTSATGWQCGARWWTTCLWFLLGFSFMLVPMVVWALWEWHR